MDATGSTNPIILYDGVCGLCNRSVQFVLRHDRRERFRFAALQSNFAHALMVKHKADDSLKTVYVLANSGIEERLLSRTDAAFYVLRELGGIWSAFALLRFLPQSLRDWAYDWIARRRYQIFGKYETCPIPDPSVRRRFIDIP